MSKQEKVQGLWKSEGIEDEARVYDEEAIFFGDQFVFIQRDQSALPVGVESGVFSIGEDGNIDFDITFDGLWRNNGSRDGFDNGPPLVDLPLSFSSDDSQMRLDDAWDWSKVDLSEPKREVGGVWSVEIQDNSETAITSYLVFLDDGTFLAATPIDQTRFSTYTGLEIGTYAVDNADSRLTISIGYDGARAGAGASGFSNAGAEFTFEASTAELLLRSTVNGTEYRLANVFTQSSAANPESIPEVGSYKLTVIVKLFDQVLFLQDLEEKVSQNTHTVQYNGEIYDYEEIAPFITTVARDEEFTEGFAAEIAESYPDSAGVSYKVALGIIGTANWEQTLLSVAGADGSYLA